MFLFLVMIESKLHHEEIRSRLKSSYFFYHIIQIKIQQNSIDTTEMGPKRCKIVQYSKLSDGIYNNPNSYRSFLLLLLYLGCRTNHRSTHSFIHLLSFRGSVQDYKIHMDMEIVILLKV
jgi:hypothetical protein